MGRWWWVFEIRRAGCTRRVGTEGNLVMRLATCYLGDDGGRDLDCEHLTVWDWDCRVSERLVTCERGLQTWLD